MTEENSVDVMRIEYKPLSLEEEKNMQKLKVHATDLYNEINDLGQSRELSLAKTKLEEVVMWATKHITR